MTVTIYIVDQLYTSIKITENIKKEKNGSFYSILLCL